MADHAHSAHDQKIAALFRKAFVMTALMFQSPFGRAQIFGPLLLQMDQCPLPATKAEMLYAGHEKVVIDIAHFSASFRRSHHWVIRQKR